MKKTLLTLMGAGALTLATVACAAPAAQDSQLSGLYVTGLAGYGKINYKKDNTLDQSFNNSSFMWAAQLGYQITPNLAVEGGYMELPMVKEVNKPAFGGDTGHLYTNVIDLMLKGIYPVNEQFDVFGKVGVGRTSQSVEDTQSGSLTSSTADVNGHKYIPIFAVGGDYNLNQHFALTAEAITTLKSGNVESSFGALAGVTYKF